MLHAKYTQTLSHTQTYIKSHMQTFIDAFIHEQIHEYIHLEAEFFYQLSLESGSLYLSLKDDKATGPIVTGKLS
jgi:hypothetical protein